MSNNITSVMTSGSKDIKKVKFRRKGRHTNKFLTLILFLGCITVFFPLYMTVIIALKQPSEMTNDVAGALSFPSSWSLDNFREAMRVTDFWNSLGNSLLISIATIILLSCFTL